MSIFGSSSAFGAAAPAADKDIEIPQPPEDSISSIEFCPTADYLAVGSWDNNVRPSLRTWVEANMLCEL